MPIPQNNSEKIVMAIVVAVILVALLLALSSPAFSLDNTLVYQGF